MGTVLEFRDEEEAIQDALSTDCDMCHRSATLNY